MGERYTQNLTLKREKQALSIKPTEEPITLDCNYFYSVISGKSRLGTKKRRNLARRLQIPEKELRQSPLITPKRRKDCKNTLNYQLYCAIQDAGLTIKEVNGLLGYKSSVVDQAISGQMALNHEAYKKIAEILDVLPENIIPEPWKTNSFLARPSNEMKPRQIKIDISKLSQKVHKEEQLQKEREELSLRLLDSLDEKSRDILESYYGMNGPPKTLREIGLDYGELHQRIQQIRDKALERLRRLNRTEIEEQYPEIT